MKEFWQLLRESIITQSLLALIVVTTITVLLCTGHTVPNELWNLAILILGFFFGAKVAQAQSTSRNR